MLKDRLAEAADKSFRSQSDIARALGLSTSAVNLWFKGKAEPGKDKLRELALLLGVSIDWLLYGEDDGAENFISSIDERIHDILMKLDKLGSEMERISENHMEYITEAHEWINSEEADAVEARKDSLLDMKNEKEVIQAYEQAHDCVGDYEEFETAIRFKEMELHTANREHDRTKDDLKLVRENIEKEEVKADKLLSTGPIAPHTLPNAPSDGGEPGALRGVNILKQGVTAPSPDPTLHTELTYEAWQDEKAYLEISGEVDEEVQDFEEHYDDNWKLVQEIINEHGAPVPLDHIAAGLGIYITAVKGREPNFAGSIRRINNEDLKDIFGDDFKYTLASTSEARPSIGGYIIEVNKTHHGNRQRFTVAHELAHYLEHRPHIIGDGLTDDIGVLFRSNQSGVSFNMEREANRIAAEILMPEKLLEAAIESGDYKTKRQLADYFGVSEEALSIRLGVPY